MSAERSEPDEWAGQQRMLERDLYDSCIEGGLDGVRALPDLRALSEDNFVRLAEQLLALGWRKIKITHEMIRLLRIPHIAEDGDVAEYPTEEVRAIADMLEPYATPD